MNKEFFKTAILNILVFLSLILAFNIWFDKELWPQGYSSFVYSLENIFPFLSDDIYIENPAISEESEFGLEWIAVSNDGRRNIVYFGDGDFKTLNSALSSVKATLQKAGSITEISNEDFKNAFKTKSIALKFNAEVSLSDYLGGESDFFDHITPKTNLMLLTSSEDNTITRYIYFTDSDSELSYKMPVKYSEENLSRLISKRISNSKSSDYYAFELNFDKSATPLDRILFDSFVPLTTQTKSIYKTQAVTIKNNSSNTFDEVFKAFGIRKNSARSYKDTDNVLNYIENFSSLKIHEDGYFSYETTNHEKGVYIGKNNTSEDVVKFANSLYQNIAPSDSMLVLKDIENRENGETVYGLIYSDGKAHLYLDGIYGATVTVKDGYISAYSQYVLVLKEGNDAFFTGSVIEAYDEIYNTDMWQSKKELTIEKILPVNFYNGTDTVLRWYIEFSDGSKEFL